MMFRRLSVIAIAFGFFASVLYMYIFSVITSDEYAEAAENQGSYTVETPKQNGIIYDCNMKPLICNDYQYVSALIPNSEAVSEIIPHLTDDINEFYEKMKYGKPFLCHTDTDDFKSEMITSFRVPVRYSENQPACHIIGYTSEGKGVCGLEMAYDTFLRSVSECSSVTYEVDGFGNALEGVKRTVRNGKSVSSGVVTTIDSRIQSVCEECAEDIDKGAIVVMDVETGEIKAAVSRPSYSVYNIADAVNDENSPLINRLLYSYCAGSVFKLLICECAMENGISDNYMYECTGSIEVNGRVFRCHKCDGHGYQDMKSAVANSCNTYFISLGQKLSSENLLDSAETAGFGSEIRLADGIYTDPGNLPDLKTLNYPAEKANFTFGQGELLVNPIQVTQFVSAIANGGYLPSVRLVEGITFDGINVENRNKPVKKQIMSESTSEKLRDFMKSAVADVVTSNAYSEKVSISAKTSTAQTGIYDENGVELCHGWVSGFFPSDNPKYAVTVFVENGGYGNISASPILKQIAECISESMMIAK